MDRPAMILSGVVLDSPEPDRPVGVLRASCSAGRYRAREPGWVVLAARAAAAGPAFQAEDAYVPPTWPAGPGDAQMMVHLDIKVDDLEQASA